jgi:hypothetical protein
MSGNVFRTCMGGGLKRPLDFVILQFCIHVNLGACTYCFLLPLLAMLLLLCKWDYGTSGPWDFGTIVLCDIGYWSLLPLYVQLGPFCSYPFWPFGQDWPNWLLLVPVSPRCSLLDTFGPFCSCWPKLVPIGPCWPILSLVDPCWPLLVPVRPSCAIWPLMTITVTCCSFWTWLASIGLLWPDFGLF